MHIVHVAYNLLDFQKEITKECKEWCYDQTESSQNYLPSPQQFNQQIKYCTLVYSTSVCVTNHSNNTRKM